MESPPKPPCPAHGLMAQSFSPIMPPEAHQRKEAGSLREGAHQSTDKRVRAVASPQRGPSLCSCNLLALPAPSRCELLALPEATSVFKLARPMPPPIQSPRGFGTRYGDAIILSHGDARGARRLLLSRGVADKSSVSSCLLCVTAKSCRAVALGFMEHLLTWQISIGDNVFTIQVRASLSGCRRVSLNGEEIHREFRPLHRLDIGAMHLPGAYPHHIQLHQPSLLQPYTFRLFVDGNDFEALSVGLTPPAGKANQMLHPESP